MNYNFSRIVETYHGETVRGNIKNKEKEMLYFRNLMIYGKYHQKYMYE